MNLIAAGLWKNVFGDSHGHRRRSGDFQGHGISIAADNTNADSQIVEDEAVTLDHELIVQHQEAPTEARVAKAPRARVAVLNRTEDDHSPPGVPLSEWLQQRHPSRMAIVVPNCCYRTRSVGQFRSKAPILSVLAESVRCRSRYRMASVGFCASSDSGNHVVLKERTFPQWCHSYR